MFLNFFYNCFLGKLIRPIFTCYWFNRLVGIFSNFSLSQIFIKSFINQYAIDMSDFVVPAGGYKTFNDFFCRKLKPGARKVDQNPGIVVSPVDGSVFVIDNLSNDTEFFVKNCRLNLGRFLQNELLAKEFNQGTLILFRLEPSNYHRFHFPFDCIPEPAEVIRGKLESLNPIVYKAGIQPLLKNERHLIILNSIKFEKILFVPVGAMMVGKVVETYTPGVFYKKGNECGYFMLGGSSIVVIFKSKIIKLNEILLKNSLQGMETVVKMGHQVAIKL